MVLTAEELGLRSPPPLSSAVTAAPDSLAHDTKVSILDVEPVAKPEAIISDDNAGRKIQESEGEETGDRSQSPEIPGEFKRSILKLLSGGTDVIENAGGLGDDGGRVEKPESHNEEGDGDLEKRDDGFVGGAVGENVVLGEDNADLETGSPATEEKGEWFENPQRTDESKRSDLELLSGRTNVDEQEENAGVSGDNVEKLESHNVEGDTDLEKQKDGFEGGGVRANVEWSKDDADLETNSRPMEEKGEGFEHQQSTHESKKPGLELLNCSTNFDEPEEIAGDGVEKLESHEKEGDADLEKRDNGFEGGGVGESPQSTNESKRSDLELLSGGTDLGKPEEKVEVVVGENMRMGVDGDGIENPESFNEDGNAKLEKQEDGFEEDGFRENVEWGKDNSDLETDSTPMEEKGDRSQHPQSLRENTRSDLELLNGGADLDKLEDMVEVASGENAVRGDDGDGLQNPESSTEELGVNFEKQQEEIGGIGVQKNAERWRDNAVLETDCVPFEESGEWFENPERSIVSTGWDEDAVIWNSEDKFEGGGGYERTEWGRDANTEKGERGVWFEGDGNFGDTEARSSEYPQRPGQLDCSYYLRTGSCSYGSGCKFNHPLNRAWDQTRSWQKAGSSQATGELKNELPEQAALAECKFYLSGSCKFGSSCRYSHHGHYPEKTEIEQVERNFSGLPLRPGAKECSYYMRTGSCKFSTNCRFHHPDPAATNNDPFSGDENGGLVEQLASGASQLSKMSQSSKTSNEPTLFNASPWAMLFPPKRTHQTSDWNDYQAPVNPSASNLSAPSSQTDGPIQRHVQMEDYTKWCDQPECPYFMKYGTCEFGSTCKYQHTRSSASNGHTTRGESHMNLSAPSSQTDGSMQWQPRIEDYTERRDQSECSYFVKYGTCKFGSTCRYQHPRYSASSGHTTREASFMSLKAPSSWTDVPIQRKPQMEDEKRGQLECSHFMKYGTCKFGSACRYQHPGSSSSNSPTREGSLVNLNAPSSQTNGPIQWQAQMDNCSESGDQPECPYFLRYGTCKFQYTCKYKHSRPSASDGPTTMEGSLVHQHEMDEYPQRPSEPECSYFIKHGTYVSKSVHHSSPSTLNDLTWREGGPVHYQGQMDEYPHRPGELLCSYFIKHGTCKFKSTCKFHHPSLSTLSDLRTNAAGFVRHEQMEEYPKRPGEPECSYFIKHGTCKFGSACKFHHPSPSTLSGLTTEPISPVHPQAHTDYPERPGERECLFFTKYGRCDFRATCKFHHPDDRLPIVPSSNISSLGLPLRPGHTICSFYTRFGICKFGSTCKFDHPIGNGSSLPAQGLGHGQSSLTDESEW